MTGSAATTYLPRQLQLLWVALPMKGNTPSITSSTKRILGASACSTTGSAATMKFAPTITTSPVQVEGQGRSEKWEVYLYGDKTIKVERDSWKS